MNVRSTFNNSRMTSERRDICQVFSLMSSYWDHTWVTRPKWLTASSQSTRYLNSRSKCFDISSKLLLGNIMKAWSNEELRVTLFLEKSNQSLSSTWVWSSIVWSQARVETRYVSIRRYQLEGSKRKSIYWDSATTLFQRNSSKQMILTSVSSSVRFEWTYWYNF